MAFIACTHENVAHDKQYRQNKLKFYSEFHVVVEQSILGDIFVASNNLYFNK